MTAARVGPMHGVQPSPNRTPSSGAAARPTRAAGGRAVALQPRDAGPGTPGPSRIVSDAEHAVMPPRVLEQPARRAPPNSAPERDEHQRRSRARTAARPSSIRPRAARPRGRRRTGRWRRRGSRAAAGPRRARRTRPGRRPGRPGSRAAASRRGTVLANQSPRSGAVTRSPAATSRTRSTQGRGSATSPRMRAATRPCASMTHACSGSRSASGCRWKAQQRPRRRGRRCDG